MPLFEISENCLISVEQTNFSFEKDLQALVEKNLETGIFNFLVGESIVRAADRAKFLRQLIHG